jgi:hypothetical protein
MADAQPLASLVPLAEIWQAHDIALIFPSESSGNWFVRQHRTQLVELGALVKLGGRWFVDTVRFPAALRAIGERTARGAVEARSRPATAQEAA